MTPKQEAKQIVEKFTDVVNAPTDVLKKRTTSLAKKCALIHVEGLIGVLKTEITFVDEDGNYIGNATQRDHYLKVKKEIQKK